jgi:hypothetical protein
MQRATFPALRFLYAVPNGGHRSPKVAVQMVAEGVNRGVPDLQLDVPINGFHGLRIEVKTPTGSLSEDQREWRDYLMRAGYSWHLCRSAQSIIDTTIRYLKGEIHPC